MGNERISLSKSHPALASEADGWDPSEITSGSSKRLPWKCQYGHSWIAAVSSRIRLKKDGSNSGCPICSNKILLKGFNDLSTKFPEIATEADGWNPTEYLAGSHEKVDWKCSKGHKWKTSIVSRTWKTKTGCPTCSGKKVEEGFNDLKSKFPDIAIEANGWDPSLFSAGSNKRMSWRCKDGHEWETTILNRTWHKTFCPICTGRRVSVGENDLATTNPEIAAQAFGWDPSKYRPGSNEVLSWKDSLGHVWKTSIYERVSNKSGCPFCSNRKLLVGFNDLQTRYPELSKQLRDVSGSTILPSSKKKIWWKCEKQHEWMASALARTNESKGCPSCLSVSYLHPNIASEAYEWNPDITFAGSGNVAKWKCSKNHIYSMKISDRTYKGTACHYCSGKKVLEGFNDLETSHPIIAREADGWNPRSVTSGSNKLMSWKCSLGHSYRSRVVARTSKSTGCPYCSNTLVMRGFNDLATKFPEIAMQLLFEDPSGILPGTHKSFTWICPEGHKWKATSLSRTSQQTGCPSCAKSGFDPNQPGWLYFLRHEDWKMYQIGITNFPQDRIKSHQRLGWNLLEIRGPMDGQLTQQWETSMLRILRKLGADLANASIAGKFDGYSEAWSTNKLQVNSIKHLMQLVEENE